jgi:hypothetical protein
MYADRLSFRQAHKLLQRLVRAKVAVVAQITPLRVQNIEVERSGDTTCAAQMIAEPGEATFDLVFTLVDAPPSVPTVGPPTLSPRQDHMPEEATRPIAACKALLQAAVAAGTFTIQAGGRQWGPSRPQVPSDTGGGVVASTGQQLFQIDARVPVSQAGHAPSVQHDREPGGPTVTYEQGYTSGDMAGLAIGMILGGLLIAGVRRGSRAYSAPPFQVVYFFALRNNVRAGIPVMR